MKNFLVLIFLVPALTACTGTSSRNLRSSSGTIDEAVYANINLGVQYMNQGNYEQALDKLERARRIDPGYHQTYNMLGLLYQQLGENDLAESSFRRAMSLNGNDPATLNNYGQFLYTRKEYKKAEELFLKAAAHPLYETPEVAYFNAGRCAMTGNDKVKAEDYFRRALDKNPTMPESLLMMADLSLQKENYLSGRAYIQRYTEVTKHTPRSLWLGIQIEQGLNNQNAVSSYALLLRNNFPDSREADLLRQAGLR